MSLAVRRYAFAALASLAASAAMSAHATVVVPALAGTTTVVGSAPAIMKVHVPAAATISSSGVTVSGNGRFAGAVLRRIGTSPGDGPVVFMIRYNMCFDAPGCAPRIPRNFFYSESASSAPSFTDAKLAAGYYQLYFFADQAPVTVRFTAAGLTGAVTYAPTKTLPVSVVMPEPALPRADPATVYFSSSVTHGFGGAGAGALHAFGFDMPIPGHVDTFYGTCAFRERPLPRAIMAPGCPRMGSIAPTGNLFEDNNITAGRYTGYAYGGFLGGPGTWTIGQYFINAGPTTNAANFFVLFDLDDAYTP